MSIYETAEYEMVSGGFSSKSTMPKEYGKGTKYDKVTYIFGLKEMLKRLLQDGDHNSILADELPDGLYANYDANWFIEKFNLNSNEKGFIIDRFDNYSDKDWCEFKKEMFSYSPDINPDNPHPTIETRIDISKQKAEYDKKGEKICQKSN